MDGLEQRVIALEKGFTQHDKRIVDLEKGQAAQGATLEAVADNAEKAAAGVEKIQWGMFLLAAGVAAQLLYMLLKEG